MFCQTQSIVRRDPSKNKGYLFFANNDGFRRVDALRRKQEQVKKGLKFELVDSPGLKKLAERCARCAGACATPGGIRLFGTS
jgi:hypothetical protein